MTGANVALVTGAASGIGRATLLRLLAQGWSVVAADVNQAALDVLVEDLQPHGDRMLPVVCDVSDEASVSDAVENAGRLGTLALMVNNAGIGGAFGRITTIEAEDWNATFAVLSSGVFYGVKHAARVMAAAGTAGSIVNIASTAGMTGGIGPHAYSAAKAAVISLTRTAAIELAADHIRVNAICPGAVGTPLLHRRDPEGYADLLRSVQPWPEPCAPEDLAGVVAFLGSAESGLITGQSIAVDGGLLAAGPGPSFMQVLGMDAGAAGLVGMNHGSTGQASIVRRRER